MIDFFEQYKIPLNEISDLVDKKDIKIIDLKYDIIHDRVKKMSEYFYHEWKKTVRNIDIYKGDILLYNVYTEINGEETHLCEIGFEDDFWLEAGGNQLALYFTTNKSLKSLVDHFTSDDYEDYEDYNLKIALKSLKELYNSFNATISEVLENTDIEEIKDYFQSQIEKEERRVHRETIKTEISETRRYSKTWFLKYLEYLNTVTEKHSSQDLHYLRFSKIEETDKPNFYKLSGCSAAIPENIDESTNVNIKIISASQRQSYNIKNISQKNQTVLIQLNQSLPEPLVDNFFVGEITYTPTIDLLGRLTNAFNHLEDWEDINLKFPPIYYIYGPPGTGKTTSLKNTIIKLTKDNPNVKILVLTPTNKACDVLAEKLYDNNYSSFLRLSSQTSTILPEDMYTNELTDILFDSLNVLISTIHRHSYFKVNTEHSQYFLYNYKEWDKIIIDEASMINLPYITFSSLITQQNNANCQVIIAGDPKQIPPVPELKDAEIEEIGVETENIYSMFGLRSFDKETQKSEIRVVDSVDNLDIQFRSLPEIGNLFSEFSYGGKVSSHRQFESKRKLPVEVQRLLSQTVTFLNVPLERDNQLFSINKLIYSSYHLYSGLLIFEFIQFFDKHYDGEEQWTIGIISPYKAQAVLVSRLIADLKLGKSIRVYSDTVHGFQGDECDIVFFICNPSSYQQKPHEKSLLANDFIYNVAISRAKDYLVIVNPFQKLTDNQFINRLKSIQFNYTKENVIIQTSELFENIIFGNGRFLDENTFITRHDDVNVYISDVYRYYIKKNEISIDFQITNK
ncbi:MAG: AAA family ATPase [Saprospiraceae bacterium]|nr:DEAD/DEAH box helicase [Candidatus Brachybacter algidus]MBK8749457.1 AAA family ATPase [Candidatus Brachybacter algidus]